MENMLEHTAAVEQLSARKELQRMYERSPLPTEDLLFNLGLYARSGLLVKFLALAELYKRFLHVPGIFVEVGCWFGQNLALLQNLQAILEPFNKTRRMVGFDTFDGYPERPGFYSTGKAYKKYLKRLLDVQRRCNVYGHIDPGHDLVEGDVVETVPRYFEEHPEAIVAFAYIDIGSYEPTYASLEAMLPRLVPGSVVLFDELTLPAGAGEAQAFRELFKQRGYTLEKCAMYPSKSILTVLP